MQLQSLLCGEGVGLCRAQWIQSRAYLFEQGERSMGISARTMTPPLNCSLLICHSNQHHRGLCLWFFFWWCRGRRRSGWNPTPLQENSWERISCVGKRGKKGWHSLRERFKLTFCGSLSPPRCWQIARQTGRSITRSGALILLTQANPETLWMGCGIWCLNGNK